MYVCSYSLNLYLLLSVIAIYPLGFILGYVVRRLVIIIIIIIICIAIAIASYICCPREPLICFQVKEINAVTSYMFSQCAWQ